MDNWGSRYKIVLPESTDTWKSLVRWPIFSRMNVTFELFLGEILRWIYHILLYQAMPKPQNTWWISLVQIEMMMELSTPSCLARQGEILTQCTLHTTVKWPINVISSWCGFWPGKVWFWSTDPIQRPITLIYTHLMDNWGSRYKIVLPEPRVTWNSLVRWPILSRMNGHFWAILGGDFEINIPYIAVLRYVKASKYFFTIIKLKWGDYRAV